MRIVVMLLCLCATMAPAWAAEAVSGPRPTDESVRLLLDLSGSKSIMDNSIAQIDGVVQQSMKQALQGQEITAEQQAILDDMRHQMLAIMADEFTWQKLEPVFMKIYADSLTQTEVDGMIEFYRTEAGRALVAKMPTIMQNTMQALPPLMAGMMPRLQKVQAETIEKLRKSKAKR